MIITDLLADPLCLDGVEVRFAGKRQDRELPAVAAIPVLSRIFVEGIVAGKP